MRNRLRVLVLRALALERSELKLLILKLIILVCMVFIVLFSSILGITYIIYDIKSTENRGSQSTIEMCRKLLSKNIEIDETSKSVYFGHLIDVNRDIR